jgi:transcriptional regulator with XRE-family HTH domain
MDVGCRLRMLREQRKVSQGDIEQRTGLLRSYISRVENGHTVPAVETLEKFARALEMPLYELLYDGPQPPSISKEADANEWGSSGKDERFLNKLRYCLSRMSEPEREILMSLTGQLASRNSHR